MKLLKTINKIPEGKERIPICSKKDFEVSYFVGPGKGGQKKNKTASGVQIFHRESGASGRASDSRSQADNKASAFKRLIESKEMQIWLRKQLFQIREMESLEEQVEKSMTPANLKIEVKNEDGQWVEVDGESIKEEE